MIASISAAISRSKYKSLEFLWIDHQQFYNANTDRNAICAVQECRTLNYLVLKVQNHANRLCTFTMKIIFLYVRDVEKQYLVPDLTNDTKALKQQLTWWVILKRKAFNPASFALYFELTFISVKESLPPGYVNLSWQQLQMVHSSVLKSFTTGQCWVVSCVDKSNFTGNDKWF